MPVKITNQLSAVENLLREGIIAITEERAVTQDIRPLKILILNLMPLKKPTELQLLRLLGNNPLQVEVDFARTVTRETTHTDNSYLDKAYLEFEEVEYWPELVDYIRWSQDHVFSVLSFCWSAQAVLYYYYGIQKHTLPRKFFGIYSYGLTVKHHPLLRGFDDRYFIPQSRHTDIDHQAVDAEPDLKILSRSVERGINICCTEDMRRIFVLGHFEYDRETLATEYIRDKKKGMDPDLPEYYYPDNDSTEQPVFKWCSYAHLFYNNWLNMVYQETPYDLTTLKKRE